MSYDIRNQKTATAQRTAEVERLNFLALKSKLNKDYEDSQFQRKENERLQIEPAIPIYRSKDELLADLTTQRQILKFHLKNVMDHDNINKFIGYTFKSPDYAILTNQYWDDIEPQIQQFKPVNASFLYEWLNRYFYTKQKMGTQLDVVVDPEQFGDLNDISKRAAHFIAPADLSDEDIKRSVREIMNTNYGFSIDPYSNKNDDEIRKFYIQEKVILPTKTLTPTHWRTIYEKEIQGFNDRIGSYLPATTFSYSGYKKGSELATPSAVIKPAETSEEKKQVVPGTFITPTKEAEKKAQEVVLTTTGEVVPVPVEPKQVKTPKTKEQVSDDEVQVLILNNTTFDEYRDAYVNAYKPTNKQDAYQKLRTFAAHKKLKTAPKQGAPLFAFLRQTLGGNQKKRGPPVRGNGTKKLTPGPSELTPFEKEFGPMIPTKITPISQEGEPNAYEKEFGYGMKKSNYYKFGKYYINKRALKKKL